MSELPQYPVLQSRIEVHEDGEPNYQSNRRPLLWKASLREAPGVNDEAIASTVKHILSEEEDDMRAILDSSSFPVLFHTSSFSFFNHLLFKSLSVPKDPFTTIENLTEIVYVS